MSTAKNANLSAAKVNKNDEFYTQWVDIEREMGAYLDYDPNVFRDKVILLPCDDPEWSNFTKYFALHFAELGIKKLISTSFAPDSKSTDIGYQPTLFETEDEKFDEVKTRSRGKMYVLEREDLSGDGVVNIEDLRWDYLPGNGDFRSPEVTALRDEADIVVTNPPFSLIREFIEWTINGNVKFSVIGPRSSLTYKDVFTMVKNAQLWLGKGFANDDAYFRVPESNTGNYAAGVYDPETQMVHFRNAVWFTNIDHGRRHEPMQLMSTEDNIRFSKHKLVQGVGYQKYDNYDAIEIPFRNAIPSDHEGVMGVPISFLDKHNPDQFEIVGLSGNGTVPKELLIPSQPKYDRPYLSGKRKFPRILIRHRRVEK
jgi:hypothetical protein